jgi:hypothetical protein
LKVKEHQLGKWGNRNSCEFELDTKRLIQSGLANFILENTNISPVGQLNDWFENFGNEHEFMMDFRLNKDIPLGHPYANYKMDAVKDGYGLDCKHEHRIMLQKCLDNRQAIGTNLLKFEIGTKEFSREDSRMATSFLVCASKQFKKQFELDGSVATFEEYEVAVRFAYSNFIESRITVLELTL